MNCNWEIKMNNIPSLWFFIVNIITTGVLISFTWFTHHNYKKQKTASNLVLLYVFIAMLFDYVFNDIVALYSIFYGTAPRIYFFVEIVVMLIIIFIGLILSLRKAGSNKNGLTK